MAVGLGKGEPPRAGHQTQHGGERQHGGQGKAAACANEEGRTDHRRDPLERFLMSHVHCTCLAAARSCVIRRLSWIKWHPSRMPFPLLMIVPCVNRIQGVTLIMPSAPLPTSTNEWVTNG